MKTTNNKFTVFRYQIWHLLRSFWKGLTFISGSNIFEIKIFKSKFKFSLYPAGLKLPELLSVSWALLCCMCSVHSLCSSSVSRLPSMELSSLSSHQVLLLSRSLLASFITLLTLWYFISPYLVASNAQFATDLWAHFVKLDRVLMFFCRNKMIAESSESNPDEEFLENWTKWRLYLEPAKPGNTVTVYPNTRLSLANMVVLTITTGFILKTVFCYCQPPGY